MKIFNLGVNFSEKQIFKDLTIEFKPNTLTAVLGNSGVGKTTLLNCIAGIVPYTGRIEDIGEVSYMFQEPRLIDTSSVRENLLYVRGGKKAGKEVHEEIEELLEIVGLSEEIDAPVSTLSGGMQSRVSLARAFLYPSTTLLMDEPFKSLDIALAIKLRKSLVKLLELRPRSVVFVTHDVEEAIELGDKIIVLSGRPAEVVLSLDRGETGLKESLVKALVD